MQTLLELLRRCAESHSFGTGDPDNPAVLDQLFCAYQDSHETDPAEIKDGFRQLDVLLYHILLCQQFINLFFRCFHYHLHMITLLIFPIL